MEHSRRVVILLLLVFYRRISRLEGGVHLFALRVPVPALLFDLCNSSGIDEPYAGYRKLAPVVFFHLCYYVVSGFFFKYWFVIETDGWAAMGFCSLLGCWDGGSGCITCHRTRTSLADSSDKVSRFPSHSTILISACQPWVANRSTAHKES